MKEYKQKEDSELKKELDGLSFDVLRNEHTERPFTSPLNDEDRKGIYVDKASGEPLFSSMDKFDAGCGWPSFTRPIEKERVNYHDDYKLAMKRTEVRSSAGDNHLGHVFNDGPVDKGGLRYCINGAALTFVPYEEMEEKGYGEYLKFFR